MITSELDQFRTRLREVVKIADLLESTGHHIRLNDRGSGTTRCPFHEDHRPSLSVYVDKEGVERFRCWACLDEHELVWAADGLQEIATIQPGASVLDHQGRLRRVLAIRHLERPVLAIETDSFRSDPLILTPDHTCLYVREDDAETALPYLYRSTIRGRLRTKNGYRQYPSGLVRLREGRADTLRPGDFLVFPVIPGCLRSAESLVDSSVPTTGWRKHPVDRTCPLPLNEDTAFLYGVWLAEGNNAQDRAAHFTFSILERHTLAQRVADVLTTHGFTPSIHVLPKKNVSVVTCCHVDLVRHLTRWFGTGAGEKRIPFQSLCWPQPIQRALIDGYIAGDGERHPRKNSGPAAATVSRRLVYGLYALAIQAGLRPSIRLYPGYTSKGVTHRPRWSFYLCKQNRLAGFYEPINGTVYHWSRITRISNPGQPHRVVDITVDTTHSFVTKMGAVHNCNVHGDVFDFARLQSGDPDHLSTLRRLAEKHQIPWPEALSQNGPKHSNVINRAARFYHRGLTKPVLDYLAGRGFPEAFIKERQIGYVPIGTESTQSRLADEARKAGMLDEALAAELVIKYRNGRLRDWFWSEDRGYIIFPNLVDGKAIGLQGRAYPAGSTTKSKYLNLKHSTHQLYNPRDAAFRSVILCEGIPDTMSAMLTRLPDTGACGILGTQGWQDDWLRLFRRASRIYVALDRDAEIQAIDLARAFGTRGRVLALPESLGPKGDLNDWLCGPAERDPDRFQAMLQAALDADLTPYALLANRIPEHAARWDLEHTVLVPSAQRRAGGDYTGFDLLRELGHYDPVFRDRHLVMIAERVGLPYPTFQEAALDLARENGS